MDRTDPALLRAPIGALKDPDAERAAFLETHAEVMQRLTGEPPTPLMVSTAEALWKACARASDATEGRLLTVSAWTAAGKTKAALALAVHLARQGKAVAVALPEIGLMEEQFRDLREFVPEHWVAMQSSLHRPGRTLALEREYAAAGIHASRTYSDKEHRAARILFCTHDAWLREIRAGDTRKSWVYEWAQGLREAVIVDEEPKEVATYSFGATDVTRLLELLGVTMLPEEARAHGFTKQHVAAEALRAVRDRMESISNAAVAQERIQPVPALVTESELEAIEGIGSRELRRRIDQAGALDERATREVLSQHEIVTSALKAAAAGRVFFARNGPEGLNGASFYAYDWGVRIPPRTVCLDGTADLDNVRAVTLDMIEPEGAVRPSYSGSTLHLVDMPPEMSAAIPRGGHHVRREDVEREVFERVKQYILTRTWPGDRVLVYWKKALHFSGFEGTGDPTDPVWDGRTVHFTSFGASKGTNKYQDCNVFIQVGHLYKPRAVYVAQLGAASGEVLSDAYLKRLAQPNTKDRRLTAVRTAHVVVRAKQDAARVTRRFDENGVCRPSQLHFISTETNKLAAWAHRMFPKATVLRSSLTSRTDEGGGARGGTERKPPAARRLSQILIEATESELSIETLLSRTGIPKGSLKRTLGARVVQEAMVARGWTLLELAKGWKLVKAEAP